VTLDSGETKFIHNTKSIIHKKQIDKLAIIQIKTSVLQKIASAERMKRQTICDLKILANHKFD
jgi:hypothetical protein